MSSATRPSGLYLWLVQSRFPGRQVTHLGLYLWGSVPVGDKITVSLPWGPPWPPCPPMAHLQRVELAGRSPAAFWSSRAEAGSGSVAGLSECYPPARRPRSLLWPFRGGLRWKRRERKEFLGDQEKSPALNPFPSSEHSQSPLCPHPTWPWGHTAANLSLAICQPSSVNFRLGNSAALRCWPSCQGHNKHLSQAWVLMTGPSGIKVNTCISDMPCEGQWCPFKQPEERARGRGWGD